jgi:type II secretory pathway pseudopilin PulG
MNSENKNIQIVGSKGFTLIELVVVLGIFILVIDVTVTIFLSVIQHQKRILAEEEMLNQASFAIEQISRGITSAVPDVTGTCLVQNLGGLYSLTHYNAATHFYQGIKFVTNEQGCQEFFIDADGFLKEVQNGGEPQNIISPQFLISYMKFVINGDKAIKDSVVSGLQTPRVTMVLKVVNTEDGALSEKVIQTTISARNYK